ncbi:hypothetical protein LCGC14_1688230 [marine sediment metagenome]|uniref:Uncharacterized protein n=1 Tax=marine sediment metagenome TaxID=412755 RepID=A0A0F9HM11_9ZZZZ
MNNTITTDSDCYRFIETTERNIPAGEFLEESEDTVWVSDPYMFFLETTGL